MVLERMNDINKEEMIENNLEYFCDIACKKVLSIKKVIASLLRYFIPEYETSNLNEIIDMIDFYQNSQGIFIESLNTERIEGREKIIYDLYVKCLLPDEKSIYIDIEPHSQFNKAVINRRSSINTAYALVSQKGKECYPPTYKGLNKVCSLWICRTNEKESEVQLIEEMISSTKQKPERYEDSYHEKIFVKVGTERSEHRGINLIQILFSREIRDEELNEQLERDYGFRLDEKEMEAIREMSGFGASYYEEGMNQGILQGMSQGILQGRSEGLSAGIIAGEERKTIQHIQNIMKEFNLDIHQAMNILQVSADERNKYLNMILKYDE